jgi:hypothetical protein
MRTMVRTADPFAMLVDPEGFFEEIEKSERLKAMSGRICRPLDRVATPKAPAHESVVDEGDQSELGDDLE